MHKLLKKSGLKTYALLGVVVVFVLLSMFYWTNYKVALNNLDRAYFSGNLRSLYGIISNEDWNKIEVNTKAYEFDHYFNLIAHGGGFKNELENSKRAINLSRKNGLALFEIDLFLYQNKLYCSHNKPDLRVSPCQLSSFLNSVDPNERFILDIKSNLIEMIIFFSEKLESKDMLKKSIIQLYKPSHFKVYEQNKHLFAGYIVSLYKAKRSLKHICSSLDSNFVDILVINKNQYKSRRGT